MDNNTLRNIAQFTTQARSFIGKVDASKLVKDPQYANDIFKQAEEVGDEQLVLLSLKIKNDLGMMGQAPAPVQAEAKNTDTDKYKFGARS